MKQHWFSAFKLSRRRMLQSLCAVTLTRLSHAASPPEAPDTRLSVTLTALLDILLPEGEFPGHRSTDVLGGLTRNLRLDATPPFAPVVELVERLERDAREAGAASFAALTEAKRREIVDVLHKGNFFGLKLVRDAAMRLHYSHPAAWRAVGFPHPPQPYGYPDHAKRPT